MYKYRALVMQALPDVVYVKTPSTDSRPVTYGLLLQHLSVVAGLTNTKKIFALDPNRVSEITLIAAHD